MKKTANFTPEINANICFLQRHNTTANANRKTSSIPSQNPATFLFLSFLLSFLLSLLPWQCLRPLLCPLICLSLFSFSSCLLCCLLIVFPPLHAFLCIDLLPYVSLHHICFFIFAPTVSVFPLGRKISKPPSTS